MMRPTNGADDLQEPAVAGFEAGRRAGDSTQPGVRIATPGAGAMTAGQDQYPGEGTNHYLPGAGDAAQTRAEPAAERDRFTFDVEALLGRLMEDRQLVRIVLKAFLIDIPGRLDALRKQLEKADVPALRFQVHTLKGAAATVAAGGLHAIVLALERAGDAGRLDQCSELLPRAVEEFERFKKTLERSGWV